MVDPVGADLRMGAQCVAVDAATFRGILESIAVVTLPAPDVVCIEDLAPSGAAIAR